MDTETRKEWLEARRHGIGSSDAPSLVGVGFRDAIDVYHDKVGPIDDRPPNGVLLRGIMLEPIVAEMYEERTGIEVRKPAEAIVSHADRPFQKASVDYERFTDGNIVECKTCTGFGEAWGEPGSDIVPLGYKTQVIHQLGVTGREFADIAALDVLSWELRVYRVMANPELFAWLSDVEQHFWYQFVSAKQPPPPDWELQWKERIRETLLVDHKVNLGDEAEQLCRERDVLNQTVKDITDRKDSITKRLKELIGSNKRARAGEYSLSQCWIPPADIAFFREGHPRLSVRKLKPKSEEE